MCVRRWRCGAQRGGGGGGATHTHSHRRIPLGLATMVFKRRWPAAAAVHVHLPRGIYLSTRPPTPRRACPWIAPRTAHRTPETCIIIILLLLCSHDESKTTTTAAAAAAADFGCIISILCIPRSRHCFHSTIYITYPRSTVYFYGNRFHQIF